MPASHPFIDVVILDGVRERFAAAVALVILSTDLDELLWANGPGAALFGHEDIETAVGAGSGLGPAARRQIMATRGYPAIGRDRSVMVRLTQGVVTFLASAIAMPDGEPAILLALPSPRDGAADADMAARAVSGFAEPGHLVAMLGADGGVLSASAGFAALGIAEGALADLADEARGAPGRLAKRLVPADQASLPAGIARLTDEPARYLLVVVDEAEAMAETTGNPEAAAGIADAATPDGGDWAEPMVAQYASPPEDIETTVLVASETAQSAEAVADEEAGAAAMADRILPAEAVETMTVVEADDHRHPESLADDRLAPGADHSDPPETTPVAEADLPPADIAAEIVSDAATDAAPQAVAPQPEADALPPEAERVAAPKAVADRSAPPLRFVWKTDTGGRFSAISPEFAEAVGVSAGDLLGRPFRQVSERLGLDPSGEIAALLERRDTWSGRSVLWPVAGTALRVPVDLAALPIYGRDRAFEGFRGFGVARRADAVIDTEAATLRLADADAAPAGSDLPTPANDSKGDARPEPASSAASEAPAPSAPADPFMGEVPALKIVPKADRRFTDKVIRLAEHRAASVEPGLSPGERNAFREIGERLRTVEGSLVPDAEDATASSAGSSGPLPDAASDVAAGASHGAREAPAANAEDASAGQSEAADDPEAAGVVADDYGAPEPDADESGLALRNEVPDPAADDGAAASDDAAGDDSVAVAGIEPSETADTVELRAEGSEGPSDVTDPYTELRDGAAAAISADASSEDDFRLSTASTEAEEVSASIAEPLPTVAPSEADSDTPALAAAADEAATEHTGGLRDAPSANAGDPPEAREVDVEGLAFAHTAGEGGAAERFEPTAESRAAEAEPVLESTEDEPVGQTLAAFALPGAAGPAAAEADTASEQVAPAEAGEPVHRDDAPGAIPADTSILARLPVPILIHSGDALFYANPEFLDLTGYASLEALTAAGGLGCVFADRYEQREAEGADRSLRLRTADGREFPIEALLRSVPWEGGHALMLVVRRSGSPAGDAAGEPGRDELRAHVAELRTIIDTATDGVIVIGGNGLIRSISRPAEALFGYESDDVAGKPFVSLFAMESQRAARDYLTSLSDHGVASVLNDGREVIGREAQGRFIPLFLSIGKLPNDGGFCAVVRDITPWKRAEEELTQSRTLAERASSHKSEFLARISHEIRTPLNAIIGFSELMIDERFGPIGNDRYRDYLRDINKSGNHVLDLVNDLLDISKIEAGQQEMTYEAVSLNDALAQTVAMMQPQANRDRVIIRSSFASRLPDVVADLRSIRQIALNLLSNAVRYTQAGGQVIVSTAYEPSGDVVIRVRDTGIGMSPAEIEQAMKPFKRINALKGGRNDGTGLGLPLTKAMVEANRARFTINSTPGEGTLVEISFPSTRVLAE